MPVRFDSPEQEVFLNLWRTYDALKGIKDRVFSEFDVTAQQYNALRVLQGEPDGLPTMEVGRRLLSRCPDTTRLLDRLETQRLVTRARADSNRRVVVVRLTGAGASLLRRLARRVVEMHRQQVGRLMQRDQTRLVKLLQQTRRPHSREPS